MRYFGLCALLALGLPAMPEQTPSKDAKVVKDSRSACQISVPGDWTQFEENAGSAVLQDASNAIAVVTSQPGQTFKPLTESMQRLMRIPKDKLLLLCLGQAIWGKLNPSRRKAYWLLIDEEISADIPGEIDEDALQLLTAVDEGAILAGPRAAMLDGRE